MTKSPRRRCAARCAEEGDVRLLEQQSISNWQTGRLEVFFEGSWGSVCAFAFDALDADVACRQLGFGAGTREPTLTASDCTSGPIQGASAQTSLACELDVLLQLRKVRSPR